MDLIERIFADHERITSLFDQVQDTSEHHIGARARLFEQLKIELIAHTRGEEEIVYPLLEGDRAQRIMMVEASEEHHLVRHVLQEMGQLPPDNERWIAKLVVLRELFEHHIDQEEEEIIPILEDLLDDEAADDLGRKLADYEVHLKATLARKAA